MIYIRDHEETMDNLDVMVKRDKKERKDLVDQEEHPAILSMEFQVFLEYKVH